MKNKRRILPISDEEEAAIQRGIAEDPDNPEWTEEDFKDARPFAEVFPELAESIRRARGRPTLEIRKKQVTLRAGQRGRRAIPRRRTRLAEPHQRHLA